jgi:ABC-type multidrug transport system fused ATPase/permease subunit
VVIHEGSIVESGHPAELLRNVGGHFHTLAVESGELQEICDLASGSKSLLE